MFLGCLNPWFYPLSATVSNNSGVSLPENYVRSHDHLFPTSSSQFIPPSKSKVPKYQLPPAPSVHPMITRSKQSVVASPHVLLTSLEPRSVHEALCDPH